MATTIGNADLLAGRGAEIDLLRRCLEAARAGRPQVVIVEGEAGIGKSSLLHAFVAGAPGVGEVLQVCCDEFEQHVGYAVAGLILDDAWLSSSSDIEVGRRLLSRLGEVRRVDDLVTILMVDDAQWMDRPSAWVLRFALRRLRVDPVLAVIARRPGSSWLGDVLTGEPDGTRIVRPDPLTPTAVRELACWLRSWDLSAETAERLVTRTGGVPLLVSAVLIGAADETELQSDGAVPPSAAAAARHLLEAVPPVARRLVEASAVLAERTDRLVVGQLSGVAQPADAISIAVGAGLLTEDRNGAVECTHALLRQAIYEGLSPARRRQLHARAARWTTGDRRLAHLVQAADQADPELAAELTTAADTARRSLQYGTAATHRLQARSVSANPDLREGLLLQAMIECVEAQDLGRAADLAGAAGRAAPAALRSLALGMLARETGRVGEAKTMLREALTLASASGDAALRQRAALEAAVLHVRLEEGAAAVAVLRHAEDAEDAELAGDATATKGIALLQSGDFPAALAALTAVPRTPYGAPWEADLLAVRGMVHYYAGHLDEALRDLDASIGQIHLWRPSTNQSRIHVLRSVTRFCLGDWDGATMDAATARALAEASAQTWSLALAHAISVAVPANRGQWDFAVQHLALARDGLAGIPSIQVRLTVAHQESSLALARQDWDTAITVCEPFLSVDLLTAVSWTRSERWVMPAWIQACVASGRLADAESALASYESMVEQWPEGPTPTRLGLLRGQLAEAHGDARAAHRHYAADLLDPDTRRVPIAHGELLLTMGRLERAQGNRRDAIVRLRLARDIFALLRATPLLERCSAELTACGLRSTVANPLALTEREADVAVLVARGYTNKEVGAELFMTPKGVDYHLGNIYAKLGISGRHELRRLRPLTAGGSVGAIRR